MDCRDNDNTIYPGAPEICDGKDNDCDTLTDEGLSTDSDGDGHYALGSCLTPADDFHDNDPMLWDCNTPIGNNVSVQNDTGEVTVTFPVVTGGGNTTITVAECEVPPEGITLAPYSPICVEITTDATFEGEAQICISYDDTGLTIVQELNLMMDYTMTAVDGWFMIGGCSFTAKATLNIGEIVVIYSYSQGSGYQRISDYSNIEPGKGYWILFKNTNEQSEFNVAIKLI